MKHTNLLTAIKGMIVGGTMLVPGVSGGSMAMILGIYSKLIHSVSSFTKHKKENLLFLAAFSAGGGFGMVLIARPLLGLIQNYPMPTLYFFMGAVTGSVPLTLKQADIRRFSWKYPLYMGIGLSVVLLFTLLPSGALQADMTTGAGGLLLLVLAGFVAAIALVLPGISVSYLFLLMGIYDSVMGAISSFRLTFLAPLGIGLLLGIVLTTKLLEHAMTKYPQPAYLIILGFVLGSIVELFPGIPSGPEMLFCILTFAVGFGIIRLVSVTEIKQLQKSRPGYQ